MSMCRGMEKFSRPVAIPETEERYGLNLNNSLRLGFLNQPNMLLTAGLSLEEATHYDSILKKDRERRMGPRDGEEQICNWFPS